MKSEPNQSPEPASGLRPAPADLQRQSKMKPIALSALILLVAACGKKEAAAPAGSSSTKKEEQSLESRIKALDSYLAKDGEPEPAEVISPVLTRRAVKEFSSRVSGAKKVEAKIRFVERVIAIVTVSYTLGSSDVPREQEIQFIHHSRQWTMLWIPPPKKKEASPPPAPAPGANR